MPTAGAIQEIYKPGENHVTSYTVFTLGAEETMDDIFLRIEKAGFKPEIMHFVHDLTIIKGTKQEEEIIKNAKEKGYTIPSGGFSIVFQKVS